MKNYICWLCVFFTFNVMAQEESVDSTQFFGRWLLVSSDRPDGAVPKADIDNVKMTIEISQKKWTLYCRGEKKFEATYKLSSAANGCVNVDIAFADGKNHFALMTIKDDTIVFCTSTAFEPNMKNNRPVKISVIKPKDAELPDLEVMKFNRMK